MNTSRKLIMIGMIREGGNKISKYLVLDIPTRELFIKSIKECLECINNGIQITGLQNCASGIVRSSGFKYRSIIGEEADEVFTVLRRIVHKSYKEYELSDNMGQVKRINKDDLIKMMDNGVRINGITRRKSGLVLAKGLDTIIEK